MEGHHQSFGGQRVDGSQGNLTVERPLAADYLLKPIDAQGLAPTLDGLRSGVRHSPRAFPGSTELSLRILQERRSLVRCHRQFLANLDRIAEIITRSGRRVPVSRRHLREMKDRLPIP